MKLYDEKLYDFLSKKENFEPYFDLHQQYEKVRKQMVDEFWDQVAQNIKANPPQNTEWMVEVDPPGTGNRKLRMKHPVTAGSPDFKAGIIYEHLENYVYLGVWVNRWLLKNEGDIKQIFAEAGEVVKDKPGWKAGSGGWWFVIHRDTGEDFRQKETLVKITPEDRGVFAKTMATEIVEAVNLFGEFCIEQVKKNTWK
jgi:hypothetical protein